MKLAEDKVGAEIDRAARGDGAVRLFLFHGSDEAGAHDHAERLARAMGSDAERIDLDAAELKRSPGLLADEAASMSLFGGRRLVRVTGAGEESAAAVELLLTAAVAGNPVAMIATGAKSSGKLVKLAQASPLAVATACYPLEGARGGQAAARLAREHGVRIGGEAATALADAAGGDRAVLARELEKIALFLDAAPDRPREADGRVLAAIGANLEEPEIGSAVEAVIAGNAAALGPALAALETAGMMIPFLRGLARRVIQLIGLRAQVDAGGKPDQLVEAARIFWKERPATIKALRRWSVSDLKGLLARIRHAERAALFGGGAATGIAAQEVVMMARAAARR